MAKIYELRKPVRDTHGNVHPKEQKVRLHRKVDTMSGTMFEVVDPDGAKFLVIEEEFNEIGEE